MAKIQVLSDTLASQVAAGEVVERPASVVKELVENSLDAGATHVEVEIQRGGTALIKVQDDGCGMSREDALLSLERHATSKLRTTEDLAAIATLGFRGEAVPSIASVSRFKISSREHDAVQGVEALVVGGTVKDVREAGIAAGTCMEARELFFNIPARRKFLRTETTESAHVEHQIKLHALATPAVRFTFRKDGRVVFDLPATHDARVRIAGLFGNDMSRKLIEVPRSELRGLEVYGYVLPAEFARKGRKSQYVFLNGRPVEDAAISRALKDGFRGAVADGLYPTAWLWLVMNPQLVDVNVHPAKREVRFHRPHEVRDTITKAVEAGLRPPAAEPDVVVKKPADGAASQRLGNDADEVLAPQSSAPSPAGKSSAHEKADGPAGGGTGVLEKPASKARSASQTEKSATNKSSSSQPELDDKVIPAAKKNPTSAPSPAGGKNFPAQTEHQQEMEEVAGRSMIQKPDFVVLSALHDRYVMLQGDDGLVLLDPKAARERVVYEALVNADDKDHVPSQGLLVPELLELDALDAELVMRYRDHFLEAGIQLDSFGGNTMQVSSLPAIFEVKDSRAFLTELIDELHAAVGQRRAKAMTYEIFAARLARRAGRLETCRLELVEPLLSQLFACDLPYCTPDGRPTLVQISLTELDRKFGK
ncbi:DNA mismatch repair endonuclease MutL [Persicirhabdus sediminis]|uniref:DNA mismatch repair protein MutL n=2 Tax=Persicirhabdus sediminis TaxID=454144 RepID=A0A8J7MAI5_9BACT|nr:DNA mismatch repair endonuclease MutL [Persicirhabdus sediminis]